MPEMDPDEYEYLERTTEEQSAEPPQKDSHASNGSADRSDGKGSKRRRGDSPDGGRERSRRSHSEGESRDRHKDRGREPRHGSGSRDERGRRSSSERRERDRERERRSRSRSERRHSDHDRERSREMERRSRSRSERRYSDHDRERSRERERRSRSRSERRYSDHDRERSRERELRERDREGRRHKKEEAAEPEADPERDQRTVFAYQLPLKADERDVYEFFSRAGKVRDVRLIMDRNSRRSKGVGYIEFYDVMSVPMAIALSGQLLLGQPVMVKPSEAEKNLVPSSSASAALSGPYSGGARRLYVGNLHFTMTEDQLKQVFEPFGQVELVQLPRDPETGHCKGFGFIQFTRLEDAKAALNLNGQLDIAGRTIKVSSVTDQSGAQEVGATATDFDDDDGVGLALNSCSRAMLMAKLDRTGTASSTLTTTTPARAATAVIPLPAVVPPVVGLPGSSAFSVTPRAPLVEAIGAPSECLLLTNMFDPTIETEPDFDLDIKEDVQDECAKFGNLKHIFVDKDSTGFVYLRFGNATSAIGAQRALHGRWFAGKMITATFMTPQSYEAKFPHSK